MKSRQDYLLLISYFKWIHLIVGIGVSNNNTTDWNTLLNQLAIPQNVGWKDLRKNTTFHGSKVKAEIVSFLEEFLEGMI